MRLTFAYDHRSGGASNDDANNQTKGTRAPPVTMASGRAPSETPVPTTETADAPATAGASSIVSEEEWKAMSNVLTNVSAYRTVE
jgi:hypothetical protein